MHQFGYGWAILRNLERLAAGIRKLRPFKFGACRNLERVLAFAFGIGVARGFERETAKRKTASKETAVGNAAGPAPAVAIPRRRVET